MEYSFYYMPPTPNKIWEDKGYQNTANVGRNTILFCKNWTITYLTTTPSKSFYINSKKKLIKSLTHEKINRIRIFLIWI